MIYLVLIFLSLISISLMALTNNKAREKVYCKIAMYSAITLTAVTFFGIAKLIYNDKMLHEQINEKVYEQNYTVYLNGEEFNVDNIDLSKIESKYLTVDDENKRILITMIGENFNKE